MRTRGVAPDVLGLFTGSTALRGKPEL